MNSLSNNSVAKKHFDSARKRLADNILNLEEVVKIRIEQEIAESQAMDSDGDFDIKTQLSELKILNLKLDHELKNVQKNLNEVGKENVFLHEKSKFLSNRISAFKLQSFNLVEQVEAKISKLEKLVKSDDN